MNIKFISFLTAVTLTITSFAYIGNAETDDAIPEGYAAYYSFDENYENSVKNDNANSLTGIIDASKVSSSDPKNAIDNQLNVSYSSKYAKKGSSLDLTDGTKGVALDYILPKNTSYTVSYWAKATRYQASTSKALKNPTVFFDASNYDTGNYNFVYSSVYSTYNEFMIRTANGTGNDINLYSKEKNGYDNWQMYTYTYDADTDNMYIYINGVEADASAQDSHGAVNPLNNDSYVYIGVNPWSADDGAFSGYIDELYIYDRVLSKEDISTMYKSLSESGEQNSRIRTVVYTGNPETDYRCGVVYGRGLQLQSDAAGINRGNLYVTSEYYAKGRWDANEYFPIWESTDNGVSWNQVGKVEDTENNTKKFIKDENGEYTIEATEDAEDARSYYDTKWSLRHQPFLYELPEDLGNLKAGTVLCVGIAASLSTTATSDDDFDGNLHTRIDVYYSEDNCRTWKFLSHITDGFESRIYNGTAIWEPYFIMDNGKLYCFYSDERGMADGGGQKLVATSSSDGLNWSESYDVANFYAENKTYRPGMPIVTKMANGKFLMVYEGVSMDNSLYTYYKVTDDIEDWNPSDHGTKLSKVTGGSPYCCTMPNGEIVIGSYSSGDVFINRDNMTTTNLEQVPTGIERAYSRYYSPTLDGRLFIVSGGACYPNSLQSLIIGVVDIGLSDTSEPTATPTATPSATPTEMSIEYVNGNAIISSTKSYDKAAVIFAAYDNNNLVALSISNSPIVANTENLIKPDEQFISSAEISERICILVWDSTENMIPLAKNAN